MNGVTKESWLNVSDPKERDGLLYDMLDGLHQVMIKQIDACECRFTDIEDNHKDLAKKFDRRKRLDTAAAGAGGIVGGAISMGTAILVKLIGWFK